jgi:hypothetical protein
VIAQAAGQAGKSGQLAAFIQQRIRHVYRRQRSTSLQSRAAKCRHQAQLGVDDLDVAHSGLRGLASAQGEIFTSHLLSRYRVADSPGAAALLILSA